LLRSFVFTFLRPPEKFEIELSSPDLSPEGGGGILGAGGGGGGAEETWDRGRGGAGATGAGGGGGVELAEAGGLEGAGSVEEEGTGAKEEDDACCWVTKVSLLLSKGVVFLAFFLDLTVSVDESFFLFLMPAKSSSISGSKGS
jgi:hypothetical protein